MISIKKLDFVTYIKIIYFSFSFLTFIIVLYGKRIKFAPRNQEGTNVFTMKHSSLKISSNNGMDYMDVTCDH